MDRYAPATCYWPKYDHISATLCARRIITRSCNIMCIHVLSFFFPFCRLKINHINVENMCFFRVRCGLHLHIAATSMIITETTYQLAIFACFSLGKIRYELFMILILYMYQAVRAKEYGLSLVSILFLNSSRYWRCKSFCGETQLK
jgi:hypothetical protein